MLKQLTVNSLGLIDHLTIYFSNGFTTITGETGSGKTSLIEALKLTLGKKSDFDLIKKGEKKASVEAVFELPSDHSAYSFINSHDLHVEPGEPLLIQRQLFSDGKSKATLNQQSVSLSFLLKLSKYLCDFVDQNDLLKIHDEFFFHQFLDLVAGHEQALEEYRTALLNVRTQKKALEELTQHADGKEIRMKILESDIEELKKHNIRDNEEPEIFERYKAVQESFEKIQSYEHHSATLSNDLIPKLKKIKTDKHLTEEQRISVQNAYEQILELQHKLTSSLDETNCSYHDLVQMEERLKVIHNLKKKHQITDKDFSNCLNDKIKQLDELAFLEDHILEAQETLLKMQNKLSDVAYHLESQRKIKALGISKSLCENLRPLNMPFAELEFRFEDGPYHDFGNSKIDLFIKTNSQSQMIPLKQGASGGELARVNFCFFLEVSANNPSDCYFFDEIDAHVGGLTSAMLGEKLQHLAESKQIFCVTHFPQMAQKASQHLVFKKQQQESGTKITIEYSPSGPILEEIDRMIGLKV